MIKTVKKVIVLAAMIVLGAAFVFAQAESPESNSSKATFGEIVTDVDNFFDSADWKELQLNNFFAFSRFGANIPEAKLDMGVAAKIKELYFGLYYNGKVVGQKEQSHMGKETLRYGTDSTEEISVKERRKANPEAVYGIMVGLSSGMGIKFTFEDNLQITDAIVGDYNENWQGYVTPSIEIGNLGPLQKLGLSLPIVYNRVSSATIAPAGNAVTYTTTTTSGGSAVANIDLFEADGNYVQPDIYLKLGLGAVTLDNNLRFNIYGVPSYKTDGKGEVQFGVGNVTTYYDPNTSDNCFKRAVYDKRFFIEDVIAPSYNFSGASESGKMSYSVTAGLPLTIRLVTHSANISVDGSSAVSVEVKDFYKQTDFHLGIAPSVTAGVKYQLLEPLSVQGGLGIDLFAWSMDAQSEKSSKITDVKEAAAITAAGIPVPGADSSSSGTTFDFMYPKLSFAAGFTFDFKQKASLDMLLIRYAVPTAAGTIYKAVGGGIGNDETSIVLTIKL